VAAQPGVHVPDAVLHEAQVSLVIEQPRLGPGHTLREPLTMGEGHELVVPAVEQQDRNRYLGQVESPRSRLRETVIPSALASRGEALPHGVGQVLSQFAGQQCRVDRGQQRLHPLGQLIW
jgi:hypothetical protein